MVRHILVPFDGSPQATAALEFVFEEHPNAVITALTVIDPVEAGYGSAEGGPVPAEAWFDTARSRADGLVERARELAEGRGVEIETDTEVGKPERVIVEYADEGEFDHIVMGCHGRDGVVRILLGSVAETVVRRAPIPVTVVR